MTSSWMALISTTSQHPRANPSQTQAPLRSLLIRHTQPIQLFLHLLQFQRNLAHRRSLLHQLRPENSLWKLWASLIGKVEERARPLDPSTSGVNGARTVSWSSLQVRRVEAHKHGRPGRTRHGRSSPSFPQLHNISNSISIHSHHQIGTLYLHPSYPQIPHPIVLYSALLVPKTVLLRKGCINLQEIPLLGHRHLMSSVLEAIYKHPSSPKS